MINLPGSWNQQCSSPESAHMPRVFMCPECAMEGGPLLFFLQYFRLIESGRKISSGRSAKDPVRMGSWRRPLGSIGILWANLYKPHAYWLTGGALTPCKIWLGRCWGHHSWFSHWKSPTSRILRALRLPTWFCYHSSPAPFLQNGTTNSPRNPKSGNPISEKEHLIWDMVHLSIYSSMYPLVMTVT